MKSFTEYLAEDDHDHLDFDKQYTCFVAYLGRQKKIGDKVAQRYVVDRKQLSQDYDEHLLQNTVSISRTSASNIVNNSVEQYTSDAIGNIRKPPTTSGPQEKGSLQEGFVYDEDTILITTPPNRSPSPALSEPEPIDSPRSTSRPLKDPFLENEDGETERELEAMVVLNQKTEWRNGDVDFLSIFTNFKCQPQSKFSLALDGIADITPGSVFYSTLTQEQRVLASGISTSEGDVNKKWPSLSTILSRVFGSSRTYEDVIKALKKETSDDLIVDYLRNITYNYSNYLMFSDEVPRDLNEREGFGDLTWPFIRGALNLVGIRSRHFEVPVEGTKRRKNYGRHLMEEMEELGPMADGVGIFDDHQIYLAEASLIHDPRLEKEPRDKFKVVRCMRDSWNSQISSIAREFKPPVGLTVFGSTSFRDETLFYSMDFLGTYRLRQIGRMLVPVKKSNFALRMEICVKACLKFAVDMEEETVRRSHAVPATEDLRIACDMIRQTRTTPMKEAKRRRSTESLFNDSHWEIKIPNARIEALQEDYKSVILAKPRTHVFYDETVLFFLQIALPDDLSTLHEDTERQVNEFFESLEIQVEAAFVDALSLASASAPVGQNYKSPNGRPTSAQIVDKRASTTGSPGPLGARPSSALYDQGRVESTILYSYTYNSSEQGKQPEIRPINGLWTAIFPFSVPVSFIRTKTTNTILMLSAHVLLRPADQVVPVAAPVDDQYNLECYSMVNLLEGLSDDPNFTSTIVPQHHYRPETPRARTQPPPMAPVLRRSVRRTIAVRSALNVRMRTTRVSPMENPLMMSIEVENNSEHGAKFKVAQLDVEVTNAVVTPLDSAGLTKLPIVLHSVDHVTFLFSISLLDNPEWNADSPSMNIGSALGSHHRQSSEYFVQPSATRDAQRQVTIVLQGTPEVDSVQGQTIHSRWNCFLDVSDLTKRDSTLNAAAGAGPAFAGVPGSQSGSNGQQKQLYAPQASHPSSLLPSQHSASGTPTPQNQNHHQLHYRNQSLPSSPQPQQAIQKGPALVRRVSSSSSPVQHNNVNNRHSMGPNAFGGESRVRRSSFTPSTVSEGGAQQQSQRGALNSANRKSVIGGWGYGSQGANGNQGLAPVHEAGGPIAHQQHPSPLLGVSNESETYEDEGQNGPTNRNSGRPALSGAGGISPGLGLDLAAQALNGVTQGRPEHDSGDGIVVSFAVTDRVVVGKIFSLEIFIVNRSRHIRRYTLVVPNRKRAKGGDPSQGSKVLPPLPSGEMAVVQNVPIDPYMEEPELLRRHVDNETTEADIICLENNVRLSPLYPLTCQTLNLRFIAIKEQLHTIDLVQLVDNDTGFVSNLRNCLCFMAEASFGALSQQVPEIAN
ncbi:hypothetical protein BGZ83_006565 [Gryganskiella cystojenkinii]|nr:hypothetical protein BGZ83_006565 [Gryganskiella cystojenkinii]